MTRMVRKVIVEVKTSNDGRIASMPVDALIDTGADATFISKEFAKKICDPQKIADNLEDETRKYKIETAYGQRKAHDGCIGKILLPEFDEEYRSFILQIPQKYTVSNEVALLVLNYLDTPHAHDYQMIVGNDVLTNNNGIISFDASVEQRDQLILRDRFNLLSEPSIPRYAI